MNTEPTARCPQCGAALPPNARAGLCPRCLMEMNLKTETVLSGEATPAQAPLPPEQIAPFFPQLEILECLGRGGMGVVYKARQKSLNRLVALKLIAPERAGDPQFAARFEKEARALAALNHPNIVTIHDHGQAGGFYYLLMEYVDGITLRQLLMRERISAREALAIVPQICDALQFAHDQGIIHRDIKPENILIDRRGRVKVADFGLAKIVGGDTSAAEAGSEAAGGGGLTEAGKVMGTPQYMSPEQIQAPGEVDHRADIYALGVVFYQMLTGELPGKKIEPPSKKVSIDVRLDEIVLRALEKKPELRYQQASALKTQVETIAEKSETPAVTSPIEARFSGTAIAGAVWAAWFLAVVPIFLWHLAVTHQFARPGTLDPTEMFLVSVFIMLPTVAAPLGTTLLGLIAVSQIRHSAGKRYGLGLALFDSLLFPLLALDILIYAVIGNVVPQSIGHRWALFLLLLLLLVLSGLDFWIVRRVWRTTNQPESRLSWRWFLLAPLVLAYLLSTVAVQKREPVTTTHPDMSGVAVHYCIFEVEAARADQLVPPQIRQRGDETADPNAVHLGGIPNTVSQTAEISPAVLHLLEAGTESFMDSQRDVTRWPAIPDGGAFAGRKRVGEIQGYVGARRTHGTWQLRLNYYLAHVVSDGESTMAELYYEGDAPQHGNARVFLIPFPDDEVKKYVVVEFDVVKPTGSPAPNLTRSTSPNNMGMNYGPETNGLQTLLELQTTNGQFAIGEPISTRFYIRNVSLTNIDIAGANWRQDDGSHISITDSEGKEFPVQHMDYSFWVQTQRSHLKPGESVTFNSSGLEFLPEGATGKDVQNPVGNYLSAPPGKYSIRYRLHFPDVLKDDVPGPFDWQGDLETAAVIIKVRAPKTADSSFGPARDVVNTNLPAEISASQNPVAIPSQDSK